MAGLPHEVFHKDQATQEMLVGGKLEIQGGYTKLFPPECSPHTEGGTLFLLRSSCNAIWKSLSDWRRDCSWVQEGCKVLSNYENTRVLHMKVGPNQHQRLESTDSANKILSYTFTAPSKLEGFTGTIALASVSTGCAATYTFTIPQNSTMALEEGYNLLFDNHGLALCKRFGGKWCK